jgi:hypothetical protein
MGLEILNRKHGIGSRALGRGGRQEVINSALVLSRPQRDKEADSSEIGAGQAGQRDGADAGAG